MKKITVWLSALITIGVSMRSHAQAFPINAQTRPEEVLLGLHYCDASNHEGQQEENYPINIFPFFDDYLKYLEDEMRLTSFADFWRWWYIFERYKGDEKGLEEFDEIVDACLERGLKVQLTLAWSTWWTLDQDWEEGFHLPVGPLDLDDWIHICERVGRRYRGRIALWNLQGEANDLEHYWLGRPIEHVQAVYRLGYRALKRTDPGTLVAVSGASPSVSRQKLDEWYWSNLSRLAGHYDSVPLNYFADVADPYGGAMNFYDSIRSMLRKLGQDGVELGMGEASIQWAETTERALEDRKLSLENQARRANEVYGGLFNAGMNKFIFWGTEFAPGGGHWPWRWGFRNFEDWWGIFPPDHKVPGTQIVYRLKTPGGKDIDLRPKWPRPADPYYPIWEVFKFWAQSAPAGSESVRLPLTGDSTPGTLWKLGAYQGARDLAIALIYQDAKNPLKLILDLGRTGWKPGLPLALEAENKALDLRTGIGTLNWSKSWQETVAPEPLAIELPPSEGFTAVRIRPGRSAPRAERVGQVLPDAVPVGERVEGYLVVRNAGEEAWPVGEYELALCGQPAPGTSGAAADLRWPVGEVVAAGKTAAVPIALPAAQVAGDFYFPLRLRSHSGHWIGPVFGVTYRAEEKEAPRKLVAHRELGHIRLQWFAPESGAAVDHYEIERSPGYEKPFEKLAVTQATGFIDAAVEKDHAYYYRVVAVASQGRRSRPSAEDNAKALSRPRFLDAEIVSHDLPPTVRVGDPVTVTVTFRNTGSKAWDLRRPQETAYWLQPTRLWGRQNEKQLGRLAIEGTDQVAPGQPIQIQFPYVGRKPGRFENHWIMYMEKPGTRKPQKSGWEGKIHYAYFGTPLLVETVVTPK